MVIFKRKTIPKEKFPASIIVRASEKGWMNEELMKDWIDTVYLKRPVVFFTVKKALLVCDSMAAHKADSIKSHLKKKNTQFAIIPGGLTNTLQPLDISVNKPFKDKLRAIWEKSMIEGDHTFTNAGRQRRASHLQIVEWILEAWSKSKVSTIKNGFHKANFCRDLTESHPVLSSNDDDEDGSSDDEEVDIQKIAPDVLELFKDDTEDEDLRELTVTHYNYEKEFLCGK